MNSVLVDRITNYLSVGGFFNPEMMDHDKVRDLLMDCRTELAAHGQACTCESGGRYAETPCPVHFPRVAAHGGTAPHHVGMPIYDKERQVVYCPGCKATMYDVVPAVLRMRVDDDDVACCGGGSQ